MCSCARYTHSLTYTSLNGGTATKYTKAKKKRDKKKQIQQQASDRKTHNIFIFIIIISFRFVLGFNVIAK